MIRARIYLGSVPLLGADTLAAAQQDRTAVGWTTTLRRIGRVADILAELHVDGATIYPAVGMWQSDLEPSLVIELLGDHSRDTIKAVAEELRQRFSQDVVLWTIEHVAESGAAVKEG